jgi:small subunit ribosomal protein S4
MSFRKRGDIVANFLILLESRIDTILYRTGFVSSIFEARQVISHKKILVNNEIINIKSYLLQPSDILSIHPKSYNKLKKNLVKRIYDKSIMFYNTNYYETNYKTLNTLFIPKLLKVDEVSYNFELSDKDINSILYYYY